MVVENKDWKALHPDFLLPEQAALERLLFCVVLFLLLLLIVFMYLLVLESKPRVLSMLHHELHTQSVLYYFNINK